MCVCLLLATYACIIVNKTDVSRNEAHRTTKNLYMRAIGYDDRASPFRKTTSPSVAWCVMCKFGESVALHATYEKHIA